MVKNKELRFWDAKDIQHGLALEVTPTQKMWTLRKRNLIKKKQTSRRRIQSLVSCEETQDHKCVIRMCKHISLFTFKYKIKREKSEVGRGRGEAFPSLV